MERSNVPPNLDGARFVVGAALLFFASVSDLRTRRVTNTAWIVGATAGLVFLAIEYAVLDRPLDWVPLAIIPLIILITYGLWYFHLLAGGADAKAIMMLAILIPFPVGWDLAGRVLPLWPSPLPPAFSVFANSLLVFLLIPLLFLVWNLAHRDLRFPAMFLGYTMGVDRAAKSFVWVTERVDEEGRVRQVLLSSKMSREEQAENLEALRRSGRTRVWVTPKIPFMVPLFGGYVAAFFVGDVFTRLLLSIMGRTL